MVNQSPRDAADWIRSIERMQVRLRGIPMIVQAAASDVLDQVGQDTARHPAAPVELIAQSALYPDPAGRTRARFILDFPDVVFNTDGTPATVTSYELWGRDVSAPALDKSTDAVPGLAAPGLTWPGMAGTPAMVAAAAAAVKPYALVDTSGTSSFRTDGFAPGSRWVFKARALSDSPTPGEFSAEITVAMDADTVPPPMPTAPVLDVARGTITVRWDGLSVSGAMPADFKYAALAHGTASSPTNEVARFGRGGGFTVIADIGYYDPQFFRLVAVDESGNRSPWSEQAVGYTTPLVDTDIILSTIDAAKTQLKNVDGGVSILPGTILTKHLVVTEDMTAAIASFLTVNVGMLNANSIWADEAWLGLADAKLVRSDMFIGKAFQGGVFTTDFGGKFQTDVEDYAGIKLSANALKAWNASGSETFDLDAATGNLNIFGGTFTGSKFQSSSFPNVGVKLDGSGLKLWDSGGNLAINATPTGSTFTGTLTSGFGTDNAAITADAGRGRPGLKLSVDTTSYWQPQILGASGQDGWAAGTLMAVSSRNGGASTDLYGQLVLGNGGVGWFLGTTNGGGNTPQAITAFSDLQTVKLQGGTGVVQASSTAVYLNAAGSVMQVDAGGAATINAAGTTIYGGLNVSGTKNFVMDHPTKPGMELLHGATESPVSGVMYWGCAVVGADGTLVVALPGYFTALVKPGSACIAVNGNGAVLEWDTEVVDNSFQVRGPAGTGFTWDVKAERMGADFPVERQKVVWTPPPDVIA